jgi:orotate phosphoribosyltransferase-like protein
MLCTVSSGVSREEIAKELEISRSCLYWLCDQLYVFSQDFRESYVPYAPLSDFHVWQLSILSSETFRLRNNKISRKLVIQFLKQAAKRLSYFQYIKQLQEGEHA